MEPGIIGVMILSLNNPYQTYKTNSTQTASPGELTLMLYNGCLKFIKQAKVAIEVNDIEEKNRNILKAQNIIREFMVTLNMDYEISKNMLQMYDYILSRLIEANMQNDQEILAEVEGLVTEFRDTWKEVIQITRRQHYGNGIQHGS
jgi:flagellar protein FliS